MRKRYIHSSGVSPAVIAFWGRRPFASGAPSNGRGHPRSSVRIEGVHARPPHLAMEDAGETVIRCILFSRCELEVASGRPAKVFGSHGQDGASAVACFRMCQALACRSFLTMLSHGCTTASLQTYGAAGEAKFGLEDSLKKFVLLMVRSLFCSSHASHIIYSVVLLRSWHDSCAAGSLRRRTSKVGGCSRRLISLASLATERLVATLPARSRERCLSLCAGTSTAPTALGKLQHSRGCSSVSCASAVIFDSTIVAAAAYRCVIVCRGFACCVCPVTCEAVRCLATRAVALRLGTCVARPRDI